MRTTNAGKYNDQVFAISKARVFRKLAAVKIEGTGPRTSCQKADLLFALIKALQRRGARKLAERGRCWRKLYQAATRAVWLCGCIRYSRSRNKSTDIMLQVIDCAVAAGLFRHERGAKLGLHQSRLVPLERLVSHVCNDPATFDPDRNLNYVGLFTRDDERKALPILSHHSTAQAVQKKLSLINRVNSSSFIDFDRLDDEGQWLGTRQLCPIVRARFADNFKSHGRMYSGRYGHQSVRSTERSTIRINGMPTVELDYSGMHARMLYHLQGIDFRSDPYLIREISDLGEAKAFREVIKRTTNIMLNAKDRKGALLACRLAESEYELRVSKSYPKGKMHKKNYANIEASLVLKEARCKVGLSFRDAYDAIEKYHAPISRYLSSDAGFTSLMPLDARIALDVIYAFAVDGIPCLSIHDSFIVPSQYQQRLYDTMISVYKSHLDFEPVIKPTKDSISQPLQAA